MMLTNQTTEVLQALVGNVEWILSQEYFSSNLRIVARVNGQLIGLVLYEDAPTKYGWRSVERVGASTIKAKYLSREDVLAIVSLADEAKLTEAEKTEWQAHCEATEKRRQELINQRELEEAERKRRQYEELKKEFE